MTSPAPDDRKMPAVTTAPSPMAYEEHKTAEIKETPMQHKTASFKGDIADLASPTKKAFFMAKFYEHFSPKTKNLNLTDHRNCDIKTYKEKLNTFMKEESPTPAASYMMTEEHYLTTLDEKIQSAQQASSKSSKRPKKDRFILNQEKSYLIAEKDQKKVLVFSEIFDALFNFYWEHEHDFSQNIKGETLYEKLLPDMEYHMPFRWFKTFTQVLKDTYEELYPTILEQSCQPRGPIKGRKEDLKLYRYWGEFIAEDGIIPLSSALKYIDSIPTNTGSQECQHIKKDLKKNAESKNHVSVKTFLTTLVQEDLDQHSSLSVINGGVIYLYMHASKRNQALIKQQTGKEISTACFDFLWEHFLEYCKNKKEEPVFTPSKTQFTDYIVEGLLKKNKNKVSMDVLATLINYNGEGMEQIYHVDMLAPLEQCVVACTDNTPCTIIYKPKKNMKLTTLNRLLIQWSKYHQLFGKDYFPDTNPLFEKIQQFEDHLPVRSIQPLLENYSFGLHFPHDIEEMPGFTRDTHLEIGQGAVMNGGLGHSGPAGIKGQTTVKVFSSSGDFFTPPYDPETQFMGLNLMPQLFHTIFYLVDDAERKAILIIIGWYAMFYFPQSRPLESTLPSHQQLHPYLHELDALFKQQIQTAETPITNCFDFFTDKECTQPKNCMKNIVQTIPTYAERYMTNKNLLSAE